jgi:predicted  nucleic acid-binding Zn-ribbon protein
MTEAESLTLLILKKIRQQLTRIEHDVADLRDQFLVQVALTTRLQNSIDRLKIEARGVTDEPD